MIDTHTHLQFKVFENNVDEVIKRANEAGIEKIIVVGTNLETSRKAVSLAEKHDNIYASIGAHPHHIFPMLTGYFEESFIEEEFNLLINHPKVIAIGETGLDRHIYENTKYKNYQITKKFLDIQKLFFKQQIKLAIKYKKSLIIHNREAVPELLEILEQNWHPFLESRCVFHCCEPDQKLLAFALKHKIFIGIDGDITYDKQKQEFLKQIPLQLLVLETDSPYFVPESCKSANNINEPKNLMEIAKFITNSLGVPFKIINKETDKNASSLFF